MTQHTPTPYIYLDAYHGIYDMPDARGAQVRIAEIVRTSDYEANAAFIVRACNSHDALVKALEQAKSRFEFMIEYSPMTCAAGIVDIDAALAQAKAGAQ